MECDAPFLKVVGELPRELNGTLYRNGPNPQFEAPGAHWFVGDGMLHAFHLENGRASYRNRWVRTPKWQAEHDAGRALFGGFGRESCRMRRPRRAPTTAASPTPTSSFMPDACWRWRKATCRPRSSPARCNRRGYCDYGKAHRRSLHRASQDRSRHRRDGVLRLQRRGAADPCPLLRIGQCLRRGDALRPLRGALCQHGARLHRHRKSPAVSDPADHRQHGARDARPAALRLGAGQGRLCRRHEAQRFGQGSSSGSAPRAATSSTS